MSFLKSVAVPVATAAAVCGVLALSAPANAEEQGEYRQGNISGFPAQALDYAEQDDFILVQGPRGEEAISVSCYPFDWTATGPNSAGFANLIAESWCFGD